MWVFNAAGSDFEVGFYIPITGTWTPEPHPDNPYPTIEEAAWRCHYLNGGSRQAPEQP